MDSGSVVKIPPANAGSMGSIPGPGGFHMPGGIPHEQGTTGPM